MRLLLVLLFLLNTSLKRFGYCDDDNVQYEWAAIFFTNSKIWSGTNREIYVVLQDEYQKSTDQIRIRPDKNQLETGGIDRFDFDLDTKLQTIKKLTIGVAYSYKFFSDWNLKKVELIDLTNNYKYEAHCNCIFTNNVRERTLFVNQVSNLTVSQGGDGANKKIKMKYFSSASVFVLVLFIAVIICVFNFLYFYKKWRLNNSMNQPNNRLSLIEIAQRRNSGANNNNQDLDADRNDDLTKTKMLSADKPPPYADLYPS